MKSILLVAVLVGVSACGNPLEPSPVSQNVICPTGCVLPPNCRAVLSPPNNPIGYKVVCDGPIKP